MFQSEGQYEVADYLHANRLNGRSQPGRVLLISLLYLVVGCQLVVMVGFFIPSQIWAGLVGILLLAAILALYYLVYTPWRIRKIFRQQRELSLPFRLQIDANGVRFENEVGNNHRPWKMFTKWSEDKRLMMLFLSDNSFVMLPHRLLAPAAADYVRQQLQMHKVPRK
jgi:hypothetical protein